MPRVYVRGNIQALIHTHSLYWPPHRALAESIHVHDSFCMGLDNGGPTAPPGGGACLPSMPLATLGGCHTRPRRAWTVWGFAMCVPARAKAGEAARSAEGSRRTSRSSPPLGSSSSTCACSTAISMSHSRTGSDTSVRTIPAPLSTQHREREVEPDQLDWRVVYRLVQG